MIYEEGTLNVDLDLEGLDGNAFSILAAFRRQAKRDGYTPAQIDAVMNEAQTGDYDHLLATIMANCDY